MGARTIDVIGFLLRRAMTWIGGREACLTRRCGRMQAGLTHMNGLCYECYGARVLEEVVRA